MTDYNQHYDLSKGAPVAPFTHGVTYAFTKAAEDVHQYDDDGRMGKKIRNNIYEGVCEIINLPSGRKGIATNSYILTNGTGHGFSLIARQLSHNISKLNELMNNISVDQRLKPVMIMPTPTYGLIHDDALQKGIEIVHIERDRDNEWRVNPKQLWAKLAAIAANPQQWLVGYYDNSPNNPTGTIRSREETQELAEILAVYHQFNQQRFNDILDAHKVDKKMIFQLKELKPWLAGINLVDDMVYWGNEHQQDVKACSFAALANDDNDDIADMAANGFVLLGSSKIGLAALRGGFVVGLNRDKIELLQRMVKSEHYFVSLPASYGVEASFSTAEEHLNPRTEHLASMNQQHQFCMKLLKAMVDGINSAAVSAEEAVRMRGLVAEHFAVDEQKAANILKHGIAGVKVVTHPKAGFFQLLDFSALKDKFVSNHFYPSKQFSGAQLVEDERQILAVTNAYKLSLCCGSWCYSKGKDCLFRVSCATPDPRNIIEFVARLVAATNHFQPTEDAAIDHGRVSYFQFSPQEKSELFVPAIKNGQKSLKWAQPNCQPILAVL
ncbi:MAG: aminotransferase class I/II-fold pyridoxal phosphate-dependent enzyme [Alphaproteobacteria bacterium]